MAVPYPYIIPSFEDEVKRAMRHFDKNNKIVFMEKTFDEVVNDKMEEGIPFTQAVIETHNEQMIKELNELMQLKSLPDSIKE